jgi:hypothetical protein
MMPPGSFHNISSSVMPFTHQGEAGSALGMQRLDLLGTPEGPFVARRLAAVGSLTGHRVLDSLNGLVEWCALEACRASKNAMPFLFRLNSAIERDGSDTNVRYQLATRLPIGQIRQGDSASQIPHSACTLQWGSVVWSRSMLLCLAPDQSILFQPLKKHDKDSSVQQSPSTNIL